jgi:hypothetical protein
MKPLAMFGLRKMADGAIRNQPWCRTCRSGAGTKKKAEEAAEVEEAAVVEAPTVETPAVARAQPAEEKDESKALIEQLLEGPPPA